MSTITILLLLLKNYDDDDRHTRINSRIGKGTTRSVGDEWGRKTGTYGCHLVICKRVQDNSQGGKEYFFILFFSMNSHRLWESLIEGEVSLWRETGTEPRRVVKEKETQSGPIWTPKEGSTRDLSTHDVWTFGFLNSKGGTWSPTGVVCRTLYLITGIRLRLILVTGSRGFVGVVDSSPSISREKGLGKLIQLLIQYNKNFFNYFIIHFHLVPCIKWT